MAFQCYDSRKLAVCGPLAEALCRLPLQSVAQEEPVDRASYLLLPIQPGLRLLISREVKATSRHLSLSLSLFALLCLVFQKARVKDMEKTLRRSIDKCHLQEKALLKDGMTASSYEVKRGGYLTYFDVV